MRQRKAHKGSGSSAEIVPQGVSNKATASRIRLLIQRGDLRAIPAELRAMKSAGIAPNVRVRVRCNAWQTKL